jgi:DNA-3-methyladenine glycosylase II
VSPARSRARSSAPGARADAAPGAAASDGRPGAHRVAGAPPLEALAHLRASDPVMARLIDELGEQATAPRPTADRPADHYGALVRSIVGQQLSTRAARSIYARLTDHFGGRPPAPEEVLAADPEQLRAAAGLSRAKTAYLRSLAEHVIDGSLALERLDELADEQVVAELTAIRGVGPWTAHMFLMFRLGRPDVLPVGDLGIRRAVQLRYGLADLPVAVEVARIAEPWRPWRTSACMLLWRSLAATPVV